MEKGLPSNVRDSFEIKDYKSAFSAFERLFETSSIVDKRRREEKESRFW